MVFCLFVLVSDCHVYISDFHREQAWDAWLTNKRNGCSGRKETILPLLQSIARSETEDAMAKSIEALYDSEFWNQHSNKFGRFKSYFSKHWLSKKEVSSCIILTQLKRGDSVLFFMLVSHPEYNPMYIILNRIITP